MAISSLQQEYFTFIKEYSLFLEKMLKDEKTKFSALQSKELPKIEQSIVVSQANAKKLENYETKRLDMQDKIGYAGLTFQQILEKQNKEELRILRPLYDLFEKNVQEIRFFNNKSMAVARDNMQALNPSAVLPGNTAEEPPKGTDSYTRFSQNQSDSIGLLQTKV